MMYQSFRWLALTIAIAVSGEESKNEVYDKGMVLPEEYSPESLASISSSISTIATRDRQSFLRRELQTLPSCRATNSRDIYVCGGAAGVTTDVCQSSTATCEGLRYDCTCGGITETSCAYCQVRTANSIMCQISGTTSTFVDTNFQATICYCEYMGYGQVNQTCYHPEAIPIPFLPPTVPAPVTPPAPIEYTPPAEVPAPAPIVLSPFAFTQMSCQAANPFNPVLDANASCSALPPYACTCSGSSETSCTYCQVRGFQSIRCMVTDSIETFTDPVGDVATCRCDYKGNGQAQSYCYKGAPPDIPSPSTAAPTVPTTPRLDTPPPVQFATETPVFVAPPVAPPVYAAPPVYVEPPVEYGAADEYGTKKSKKRRLSA